MTKVEAVFGPKAFKGFLAGDGGAKCRFTFNLSLLNFQLAPNRPRRQVIFPGGTW